MIRRLILWRLNGYEKRLGESLEYLRHMVRVSVRLFFKFTKLFAMANVRKVLPPEAIHVATIVGTRTEDCGPCVQIGVNIAMEEGVREEILQTILDRRPEDLPAELANVYRFTEAVLEKDDSLADELRENVRAHFGEEGLVEVALAIASCRIPATTKRALGYAKSCRLVTVRMTKSA